MRLSNGLSHTQSFKHPEYLFLVEKDKVCIAELEHLFPKVSYPGLCMYEDLENFLSDHVNQVKSLLDAKLKEKQGKEVFDSLLPLIRNGTLIKGKAKCTRHGGKECCLRTADHNHTSSPCTDFSPNNRDRPGLSGKTFWTLCVCLSMRALLQERRLTYENVPGLMAYLSAALGHLYWLDMAPLVPDQIGFAVSRPREFIVGRHKVKSLAELPPLNNFAVRFSRVCKYSWVECMIAHLFREFEAEIDEDLQWALSRPTATCKTDGLGEIGHYKHNMNIDEGNRNIFFRALNGMEVKHLGFYSDELGAGHGQLVQLKDNPTKVRGHHSINKKQHALIKTCGILFTENDMIPFGRWQIGSETCQVQGFRTNPKYFKPKGSMDPVCAFNTHRAGRRSEQVRQQMGNAMHLFVYMVVLLHHWWHPEKPMTNPDPSKSSTFFRLAMRSRA